MIQAQGSHADRNDAAIDHAAWFSFLVTSLAALRALSGRDDGIGGDLRSGETGPGAGLRGADRICAAIAERSPPDSGRGDEGFYCFALSP